MEGKFSGERNPQSILERIKNAQGRLGVSSRELESELIRLTNRGNEAAKGELSKLFNAYLSWELRESPKEQSSDDIRSRALRAFDVRANLADTRLTWGDNISPLSMVNDEILANPIGRVRQFYRDAVDYHPPAPPSSSF